MSSDIGTYIQNLTEKIPEMTTIIFIDLKAS